MREPGSRLGETLEKIKLEKFMFSGTPCRQGSLNTFQIFIHYKLDLQEIVRKFSNKL